MISSVSGAVAVAARVEPRSEDNDVVGVLDGEILVVVLVDVDLGASVVVQREEKQQRARSGAYSSKPRRLQFVLWLARGPDRHTHFNAGAMCRRSRRAADEQTP